MSDTNQTPELPSFLNRKLNKVQPASPQVTPRFKAQPKTKKASEVRSVKPTKAIQKRIEREDKARKNAKPVIKPMEKLEIVKLGKAPKTEAKKPAQKLVTKPAPKKAKADGENPHAPGSIRHKLFQILHRKGGATYAEIKKHVGLTECKGQMHSMERRLGKKLKADKASGDDQRWGFSL